MIRELVTRSVLIYWVGFEECSRTLEDEHRNSEPLYNRPYTYVTFVTFVTKRNALFYI